MAEGIVSTVWGMTDQLFSCTRKQKQEKYICLLLFTFFFSHTNPSIPSLVGIKQKGVWEENDRAACAFQILCDFPIHFPSPRRTRRRKEETKPKTNIHLRLNITSFLIWNFMMTPNISNPVLWNLNNPCFHSWIVFLLLTEVKMRNVTLCYELPQDLMEISDGIYFSTY